MPASPSAARTYVRRFVSRNRVASTRGIPAWSRLGDGKRDQRDGGLTGVETQVDLDLGENESSAAFLEPHPDQVARLELVGDGDVVRPEEPGTVVERDDFLRHLDSLHPTLHVVGRGEAGPEQHAERECPR